MLTDEEPGTGIAGGEESLLKVGLVATAGALASTISDGVPEGQRQQRLPDRTLRALEDSGLLHALRPARFGGFETDPHQFFRAMIEVARVCCATSWTMGSFGVHEWMVGLMPCAAQEEFWDGRSEPLVTGRHLPNGRAEPCADGYVLSGSWPCVAGSAHARWLLLGGNVDSPDCPSANMQRLFLVPTSETTLQDDWHTFGLRATGSRTVVVTQTFVPEHRTIDACKMWGESGSSRSELVDPLYATPPQAMLSLAACVPVIGATLASSEQLRFNAERRTSRGGNVGGADDSHVIAAIGSADQTISSATRSLFERLSATIAAPKPTRDLLAKELTADCATTVDRLVGTLLDLYTSTESSVVYSTGLIQRHLCDVLAARAHELNDPGRTGLMLGLELLRS